LERTTTYLWKSQTSSLFRSYLVREQRRGERWKDSGYTAFKEGDTSEFITLSRNCNSSSLSVCERVLRTGAFGGRPMTDRCEAVWPEQVSRGDGEYGDISSFVHVSAQTTDEDRATEEDGDGSEKEDFSSGDGEGDEDNRRGVIRQQRSRVIASLLDAPTIEEDRPWPGKDDDIQEMCFSGRQRIQLSGGIFRGDDHQISVPEQEETRSRYLPRKLDRNT